MRQRILMGALLLAGLVVAVPAFAGGGKSSSNAIWIVGPAGAAAVNSMSYGSTFEAGYTTSTQSPVGHVQCFANSTTRLAHATTGPIWDGYRFPQSDGNMGMFTLNDPLNQEWLGGGANCTLSLQQVKGNGSVTTLASMNFTVAG